MRRKKTPTVRFNPKSEHQARVLEGVGVWASYYRANVHRFAIDYLHISLKLFQMFLLILMDKFRLFVFVACRGIGKTFIVAVFCCVRCILYPGTKICVASSTRGQAYDVIEKIMTDLRPNSPELVNEINMEETSLSISDAKVVFRNGSYIKVVTASDSSRGNRAHILVIDEFRLVKKDIIDTILRKFIAGPRHPKYLDLPEYKHDKSLQEHNKTIYASSAYYKDHWSFMRCKDACRFMLDETKSSAVCGFPYQLAIQEGLLMEEEVADQMSESDFNEAKWSINISVLLKLIELFCQIGVWLTAM